MKRSTIGIAIVCVAALWFGFRFWSKANQPPNVQYKSATAKLGRIEAKITATGTLSALVTVQVGSQVSGRLVEVLVDYNSPVKKGQVIARIDPHLFEAALEQTKANLTAADGSLGGARAQYEGAKKQFDRAKVLRSNGLLGQNEYDTFETSFFAAKAQIQVAEGSLAQARAAYNQAKLNLQYTTIKSPINGIVISKAVDVGQTVAASFQAPVLFTIAEDLSHMQVDTFVAEADVGRLSPDMPASFTVDAYPREVFWGKIRQIRSAPTTVQNVVTYDAVINVANPELKLRPGMTANVTVVTDVKSNILSIPMTAMRVQMPGDEAKQTIDKKPKGPNVRGSTLRQVWVLPKTAASDAAPKPRAVQIDTGLSDGKSVEVIGGDLHEGDRVITEVITDGGDSGKGSPRAGKIGGGRSSSGAPRRIF